MSDTTLIPIAHNFVRWLLVPTVGLLLLLVLVTIWELGILIGEGCWGLRAMRRASNPQAVQRYGRVRIERAGAATLVRQPIGCLGTRRSGAATA